MCRIRHHRQIDEPLEFGLLNELQRPLADVHRDIADPFDVFDDFHRRGDESQVARDRLLESKGLVAQIVDGNFQFVDFVVPRDDVFRKCRPAFDQ